MELLPGSGIKQSWVAIICIRFKRCNKCFSLLMPDCSQLQLKSPTHEERPKGSGRELGDGDRVRACTRVLLLGWKPFLKGSLAQKTTLERSFSPSPEGWSHPRRRVAVFWEQGGHVLGKGSHVLGLGRLCPRRRVPSHVPLPWAHPEGARG